MPGIPESPRNASRNHLRTPTPAARSGILEKSNDLNLRWAPSQVSRKEILESSNNHNLIPTPSQTSIPESFEGANDRNIVPIPSKIAQSETLDNSGNCSLLRNPSQVSKSDVIESFRNLRLLRTPSPTARSLSGTSPNTLNNLNEQDPAYLRTIQALRSAHVSTESIFRPLHKAVRPHSLAYPAIHQSMTPPAPQRSFTSMGVQTMRDETPQGSEVGSRKSYMRFVDRLRGRRD